MQSAGHMILKTTQLGLRRSERWLFQNLSFSLSSGQVIQVTGSNGSGKTSLLRCVCGLLPQQTGEVDWQLEEEEPIIPLFFGHSPSVKTELTSTVNWFIVKQSYKMKILLRLVILLYFSRL